MKKQLLTLVWMVSVLMLNGQNPFGPKQTISTSTGTFPRVIESGHLDNDSYADILVGTDIGGTVEWYKNNGNGTFSLQTLISSTLARVNGVAIADIDGDTDNDVVAVSYTGAKAVWYENDGFGNFGTEQLIAGGMTSANAVKVGDIDNNGTMDVVVSSFSTDNVYWYSNNGSGSFGGPQNVSTIANSGPLDIDLADHDNDGDLDVVVAYGKVDAIILFNNDHAQSGTANFIMDSNLVDTNNFGLRSVRFGDVNDDGDLEVVKVDQYLNTSWYNKSGGGSYTETVFNTSNSEPAAVLVADLNLDSSNDVLVGYSNTISSTDNLTWYEDSSSTGEATIDSSQNDIYGFTLNDFDNDGDLDMASVSSSQNHLNWFLNSTNSLSTSDFEVESVSIYPNPASNEINFKGPLSQDYQVVVYDMLGKQVTAQQTINSFSRSIDVSNLSRGIYIVDFANSNTSFKFIKQ